MPVPLKPKLMMHASCVALGDAGILIVGPPGSGKSDLVLQLIDRPGFGTGDELIHGQLVADDQTIIERRGDDLIASSPKPIAGLLEIRGQGIIRVDHRSEVRLALLVDVARAEEVERLPEKEARISRIAGVALPRIRIDPGKTTAAARIRAALTARSFEELRQVWQDGG